jgi:hypothetical protein
MNMIRKTDESKYVPMDSVEGDERTSMISMAMEAKYEVVVDRVTRRSGSVSMARFGASEGEMGGLSPMLPNEKKDRQDKGR